MNQGQANHMPSQPAPVTAQHASQGSETLHRTSSQSSTSSSQMTADSSQDSDSSTGSSQGHRGQTPPTTGDMVSTASMRNTAGVGAFSPPPTVPSPRARGDVALGMSGVMPRRGQLPAPPTPTNHPLSRVFKVIFLGESAVGECECFRARMGV